MKTTVTMVRRADVPITRHVHMEEGYSLSAYSIGDVDKWVDIVNASDKYNTITRDTFFREFGSEQAVLGKLFFMSSPTGEYVGTSTAWVDNPEAEALDAEWGRIHWVSVVEEHRGKGLARRLVTHCLGILSGRPVYLDGRSERKEAFALYESLGFYKIDIAEEKPAAVILAAGKGTRFGGGVKCLSQVDNVTLLDRMLRQLSDSGIYDITIVSGYKSYAITSSLKGRSVRVVNNTEYNTTDNAFSLAMYLDQRKKIKDTIVLDSDMYLDDELIKIHSSEYIPGVSRTLMDVSRTDKDGMKADSVSGGLINKFGKDQSIGTNVLPLISSHMLSSLREDLDNIKHWITSEHCAGIPVCDISGIFYHEVDTQEDLKNLKQAVEDKQ